MITAVQMFLDEFFQIHPEEQENFRGIPAIL